MVCIARPNSIMRSVILIIQAGGNRLSQDMRQGVGLHLPVLYTGNQVDLESERTGRASVRVLGEACVSFRVKTTSEDDRGLTPHLPVMLSMFAELRVVNSRPGAVVWVPRHVSCCCHGSRFNVTQSR
ncbi:hypothetical protein RRG08_028664 [Elysia crispata]|uniref:Uncharacterized protein n=1 Tax=Elysia crispata TaxID=231223 RepID=A0AAE1DDI1_9GAST|nr:hypothetical protein RRG08_028664 [Elysia crispata]